MLMIIQRIKSVLCVILLAAMIFSVVSCGESPSDDDFSESSNNIDTDITEEITDDELPKVDLGGIEITILCHETSITEFLAESETADIVNDAVYQRNLNVSERFNVKITPVQMAGAWGDQQLYLNAVRNNVLAGEDNYNIVAGMTSFFPILMAEGMLLNLYEFDYLDFTKPWWGEEIVKELSVGNKLYLVTGDIALSMWNTMNTLFFNKKITNDFKIPNLYEIVKNKQWTIDKMMELSRLVFSDLDGDLVYTEADLYGYVTTNGVLNNGFSPAFDLTVTYKDENNIPHPELNIEKWAAAVDKLYDLIFESDSSYILPESSGMEIINSIFINGRALFMVQSLDMARDFRAMETDFGILPLPMYDENQGIYNTGLRDSHSQIGIPITANTPNDYALIIEALASESYRTVIPSYYEVSMKIKSTRDEESSEMLDLMRENIWVNFGYAYTASVGGIGRYFRDMMEKNSRDFVSHYESTIASRIELFNTYIQKVLDLQ